MSLTGDLLTKLSEANAEITALRAENSSLSAWQCVYTDGKTGLVGDEHGNQYCAIAKENERLRAALESAEAWLERWAVHVGRCEGGLRCTCGLTAIRYEARAALAAQPATGKEE